MSIIKTVIRGVCRMLALLADLLHLQRQPALPSPVSSPSTGYRDNAPCEKIETLHMIEWAPTMTVFPSLENPLVSHPKPRPVRPGPPPTSISE